MKKFALPAFTALYLLAHGHVSAWGGQGGDIMGRVVDLQGNPVGGVEILAAHSATGRVFGRSLTNGEGEYIVADLEKGNYNLTFNPRSTGFKGQTVVAAVDQRGLDVSWTASPSAPAIATASALQSSTPQITASPSSEVIEPTIVAATSTVTSSDSSITASSPIQIASAQGMESTSGTTNTGQQTSFSSEEERRRRNLFLIGLGLVAAGVGGAAGSGAFDSDDDVVVSPGR